MSPSPYAEATLKQHFRVGDSARWKVDVATAGESIAISACSRALMNPPHIKIERKLNNSGKTIHFSSDIETDLIMRATYKKLLKQYSVNLPNRTEIISGIIEATSEATPYKVTKCDIRSFYECLNAEQIVSSILTDTRTNPDLKSVLRQIYNILGVPRSFVPRGLAISTVIAELSLKEFDQKIRKTNGVHRYFRFADDIIVFTTPGEAMLQRINEYLGEIGLELNEKTKVLDVNTYPENDRNRLQNNKAYTYLGYQFSPQESVGRYETREFSIQIADAKIKKRMTRAFLALYAFKKDRDGDLLIDRLNYLSTNRSVYKTKHSRGARRQKINTGIHYSYPYCGHYPASKKGRIYVSHNSPELIKLDAAIKTALFGAGSEFSGLVSTLPPSQKSILNTISFAQGYRRRLMKRFTRRRVRQICEAWGNE